MADGTKLLCARRACIFLGAGPADVGRPESGVIASCTYMSLATTARGGPAGPDDIELSQQPGRRLSEGRVTGTLERTSPQDGLPFLTAAGV